MINLKITWKLFLVLVLTAAVTLLCLYFSLMPQLRHFLIADIEKNLLQKSYLIRDRIESMSDSQWNGQNSDALADHLAQEIDTRVTLINRSGRVLGDSDLSLSEIASLENHLQRPEVQEALQHEFGRSVRYSTTVQTEMMYLALKNTRGFIRVALPLHLVQQTIFALKKSVLTAVVAALALASLIAFFLSRSVAKPLQEMSKAAHRIALGDFSKKLRIATRDEIGSLAISINAMGTSLQRQLAELKNEKDQLGTILDGMIEGVLVTDGASQVLLINPALQKMLDISKDYKGRTILECLRNQDIHDAIQSVLKGDSEKETEIRLTLRSQELFFNMHTARLDTGGSVSVFYDVTQVYHLENMRRDFVANVSHELKTPLTNILGYAETLRNGALSDPEVAGRFVQKIESNASNLQALVEDILKLSEIESGRMDVQPTTLPLKTFLQDLTDHYEDRLHARQLSLHLMVSDNLLVLADPAAFKQIIGNLLDNAIQYTPTGGNIHIRAARTEALCQIDVQDTGIGIAAPDLEHIFERFYRADKARSRAAGGTGLGLAIVKHLVHAHDGRVFVASQPGQGSVFSFTLPIAHGEKI